MPWLGCPRRSSLLRPCAPPLPRVSTSSALLWTWTWTWLCLHNEAMLMLIIHLRSPQPHHGEDANPFTQHECLLLGSFPFFSSETAQMSRDAMGRKQNVHAGAKRGWMHRNAGGGVMVQIQSWELFFSSLFSFWLSAWDGWSRHVVLGVPPNATIHTHIYDRGG